MILCYFCLLFTASSFEGHTFCTYSWVRSQSSHRRKIHKYISLSRIYTQKHKSNLGSYIVYILHVQPFMEILQGGLRFLLAKNGGNNFKLETIEFVDETKLEYELAVSLLGETTRNDYERVKKRSASMAICTTCEIVT